MTAPYHPAQISARIPDRSDVVPRIARPDPGQFQRDFVEQRRPAIVTGLQDAWPAMTKWTPRYFAEHFGDLPCQLNVQRASDYMILGRVGELRPMTLGEAIATIEHPPDDRIYYLRAFPVHQLIERLPSIETDFEVPRACPNFMDTRDPAEPEARLRNPLTRGLRSLARSLFRNAVQLKRLSPEERHRQRQRALEGVLFIGNPGTLTPLHTDGMTTGAYLSQIAGRKYVYLLSPAHNELVYPRPFIRRFGMSLVDFRQPDLVHHPRFTEARPLEIILNPGETLYIPHGWWHAVISLDVTISYGCQIVNDANILDWVRALLDRVAGQIYYKFADGGMEKLIGAQDWKA